MLSTLFPVAEKGFAIIGSQYRGTFDKKVLLGKYDEFGGVEVADVVKLMDFIPHIADIDVNRIGMYGYSRGRMQTFLTLKKLPVMRQLLQFLEHLTCSKPRC